MSRETVEEPGGASTGQMLRLVVLILGLGAIGLSLLSYRQLRLQALHEHSAARLRQSEQDMELWKLRAEIASSVTPERVGLLATEHRLQP
ncbi:MAG TPA: hypothetical protein ENJ00_03825 [Phycisphaerales bacterium]|nr:hypothetical protein [Phycisphaerales bacterium]